MTMRSLRRWGRRWLRTRRVLQALAMIGTGVATAAVLAVLWAPTVALAVTGVVAAHELAHHAAARARLVPAALPILVPVGVGALGLTVIGPSTEWERIAILAAGPLVGLLAATVVVVLVSGPLGWGLMGWETWSLTGGSDGRKIRRTYQEMST